MEDGYIVEELAFACSIVFEHTSGNRDSATHEQRERVMAAIVRARAELQTIYSRLETEQYVAEVDG